MVDQLQEKNLIPFIHVLRGAAPMLVMWCHLGGWWFMEAGIGFSPWALYQGTIADGFRLKQSGAHFGVAIFFLISGYIISHVAQSESRIEFAVKRTFRLMPTLFIASGAMAVGTFLATTYGWRPMLGDEATNLRDYLMSALMLNFPVDRKPLALATTWSLWAEVLFYVMVVLIIPIIRSRPLLATWILTAAELAVMLPYKVSADLSYLGYFSIYLPLFVIGRVFYLHHTGKLDGAKVAGLLAANALVFVLMYEFRFPGLLTEGPTEAVWTYVLAVLTFQIFMVLQLRSVSPLLSFFADISYALYLLHLPVGGLAMSFAYSFGLEQIWVFLFGVCASVTAAYLVTRFVEKPAQRVGRSVLNRLPKTSPVAATDP